MKKWQKGTVLFIVILIVALGTMVLFFPIEAETETSKYEYEQLQFVTPVNDIPQEENVVYINNDEAEWIWKAKNGVLDEYVDVWWNQDTFLDVVQAREQGNFYFGTVLMPQSWWINMSEDEREVRVRMLQSDDPIMVVYSTKDWSAAEREKFFNEYLGQ